VVDKVRIVDRIIGAIMVLSLLLINIGYTTYAVRKSEARSRENNTASNARHDEAREWTCSTIRLFLDRFEVYPPENAAQEKLRQDHLALWNKICV
jgi:predicted trehalose synthase